MMVWIRGGALVLCAVALTLGRAVPALSAGEVVVTVSPPEVEPGRDVEVLIRTFVPLDRPALSLPTPTGPYPGPSDLWDVLYPWGTYPFSVDAVREGSDPSLTIAVHQDPADATLWRGTVTLPTAGTWTVRVRNFPEGTRGASATVLVRADPGRSQRADFASLGLAVGGLALGLVLGLLIGRLSASRTRQQQSP